MNRLSLRLRRIVASVSLGAHLISGGRPGSVRRVRSAVIGIGLSLVPLVLVLQVADGMIRGIAERYVEAGTYHLQASPRFGAEDAGFERVAERLSRTDGVEFARPERRGLGLAYTDSGRGGATVRAVSPRMWDEDGRFRAIMSLDEGEFDVSNRRAVLGRDMARRLEVEPGDPVRILTVRSAGERFLPRVSTFEVAGIVSSGYQDLDRLWVFVDYQRGVRMLPDESSSTFIGLKIDDPYGIENPLFSGAGEGRATEEEVRAALPAEWQLSNWFDLERSQYMSFLSTKNLLLFVMFLIVCVASVNIASTLVTMSIEKREELAILKSTGSSAESLRNAFLSAGFLIGVAGTLLGLAVGLAIAVRVNELIAFLEHAINTVVRIRDMLLAPFGIQAVGAVDVISTEFYLERIPVTIDLPSALGASVLAILVATLSAVIPARRAAAVRPLEILRRH
ncbi:MAG: ABC transporter permease [Spirochaetales bacterium]